MKRTEIVRKVPMRRGTTQLKRTRLKPRSDKTARLYRTLRVPLVKLLLKTIPICQRCSQAPSTDVHEPLLRSRGGDPLDPAQCVALCRPCHSWIHANPAEATAGGWMRSAT